jgi:tetratricopeptide (TPR) repeat protein
MAQQDRVAEAEAAFSRACRLRPNFAFAYLSFGTLLSGRGKLAEAIPHLRKAVELEPNLAEAHCNLAAALQRTGQFVAARNAYRRGHQLGSRRPDWPYPSAQWLRNAERLVQLERKLPAVLRGEVQPRDQDERLGLAEVAIARQHYVTAVRLYAEAFAADPAVAEKLNGHRYNAACGAALAAAATDGEGARLDERDRAALRGQALGWLRAELDGWRALLEGESSGAKEAVVKAMRHWLGDPDLAGVRDEKSLARLPQGERGDWQQLWQEVESLRQRANPSGSAA